MEQKPTIVVLGVGRLGSALASVLATAGYKVAAVTARRRTTVETFSIATGIFAVFNNVDAAAQGDIILLTVPDRSLLAVLDELVAGQRLRRGQVLLHTSGVLPGEVLAPARQFGVAVGSMHPLQSFADIETARQNLPGSAFAIDGDPEAVDAAKCLVADLGGRVLRVPPQERALYHAAACMASNYLVVLLNIAEQLMSRWTVEQQDALQALLPLVTGTLRNVSRQGTAEALTGPILRGDASTVAHHIKALPEEFLAVYQSLGKAALGLTGNRITPAERRQIDSLLASNDSQ
ncbi:hypothetical protein SCACP_36970 [Sporomusa carbonis]|uniref:Rossmann-like and DUF2520 domain-containing protein n=1 Tax=Sporomusa carbonis TaxID=3076075 RepID=UPI003A5ECD85